MNNTQVESIINQLKSMGSEKNREGMARFGIEASNAFGVSVTEMRKFGRAYSGNHELALALWKTGFHDAQMLAGIIDDPKQVTKEQMNDWVKDLNSWDVCDMACTNLFDKTDLAAEMAIEWSTREPEFEKRAAFSLMAGIAWHRKDESDETFLKFLPIIKRESTDERNFVKKAVNWALREIGKRNSNLHAAALKTAEEIKALDTKSSRWIANDAIRELKARQV